MLRQLPAPHRIEGASNGLVESKAIDRDTQQVPPCMFRSVEESRKGDLLAWLAIGRAWLMAAASGRADLQNESSVAARISPRRRLN
jgi:hypothetical protein